MLDLLALRLVSDQADDGSLKPSYYPVRDLVWVGGRPDASSVSIEHGLGTDALWVAARALNDPRLRDAAVLALGRSMGWLRICPGVELAQTSGRPTDSGLPSLGGMSETQILEWCGPVDDRSRPTAVSEWSSPGGDPAPVPDDIAFVVQGGTARTADSALLAIGLARHLRDPSLNLTERKRLESLLDALVRFLIYMQTPDGRFQSHFVLQDHPFWNQTDPRTDGLALMALARVRSDVERGTLEVESGEDLAETLVAGFAAQARLFEDLATTTPATETTCSGLALSVPWVVFAAWQAERSGGVDGATDAAMAGLDPLVTGCLLGPDSVTSPDLAGAYVYGLGTLPGVGDVLVAASAHRALGLVGPADPRRAELSRAADLGLLLASRLVIRPGHNDQWLPVPTSAYGGVSTDLATHRQRPSGSHAVVMLLSTVLD